MNELDLIKIRETTLTRYFLALGNNSFSQLQDIVLCRRMYAFKQHLTDSNRMQMFVQSINFNVHEISILFEIIKELETKWA